VPCGGVFHQRFIDATGAIAGIAIWTHSPNEASDRLIDAYLVPAPILRQLLTDGHASAASLPRSPASDLDQAFEGVGVVHAELSPGIDESEAEVICAAAPVDTGAELGAEVMVGGS
jgi:hypothetical protein